MEATEANPAPRALDGLRVIELGSSASVAVAGLVLADNGADVIGVEPPTGSALRSHAAFAMWARGKRSLVADLSTDAGRAALDARLVDADVLLVGLKPAAVDRLGLDPERLAASNPRLVQCAVSGFGTRGPFRDVAVWDGIVSARGGRMQQFASLHGGERPAYVAVPVASHAAAMLTLQGVLGALRERERTGRGQRLETSLLQALTVYDMMSWFPGASWEPSYVDMPFIPYSVARTADGVWVQFAQNGPRLFGALVRVLDLDPNVSPPMDLRGQKIEQLQAFRTSLQERMLTRTWPEWQEIFAGEREISAEPFLSPGEALDHPQLASTGDSIELDGVRQLGPLIRLSETPGRPGPRVPALGDAAARGWTSPALAGIEPTAPPASGGLFEGVTLLEFATWIATPFGATLMADLGARVIKVEPLGGDPMRGPAAIGTKMVQGKQSIALDLKTPEGREIAHRLVARADALAHNYRPGVPERLGIDWETLREINPRLVYLYGASYGSTGPMSSKPAFHVTAGAISGGARAQAGSDALPPGDTPLSLREIASLSRRLELANEGNPDFNAAAGVAAALALGLYTRERTGRGQALETRMMLTNAYTNSKDFVDFEGRPARELPDAQLLGLGALYRLYATSQGWVFLAAPAQRDFERLCAAAGCAALLEDSRFAAAESRARHDEELAGELVQLFATRSADDWEQRLTERGVACVRADEGPPARWIYQHPNAAQLGWYTEVAESDSAQGAYRRYGKLVTQDRETGPLRGAFRAGEDTRALLAELDYGEAEIAALLERGVVAEPD
ncbi:MAG: CoA transferase [Myxococcota bacterium]|nr:CoA transferase [Myxococcota bacterium]